MVRATVFTLPDDLTPPPAENRRQGAEPFARYLLGAENIVLRQAAETILAEPLPYSPIVIYGQSGAGKSHFLQLLAERRAAGTGETLLTTGGDFARTFGRANHNDTLSQFRSRLRRLSVLLIDDLHQLVGKTPTQQELVRTIDAVVRRGGLVLAAMRQPVLETSGLLPSLTSRLAAGLSLPLQPPGLETRRALVSHFARQQALELTPEVIELLAAEHSKASPMPLLPGQLLAMVTTLARLANDTNRPVNAAMTAETIELQLKAVRPKPTQILTATARYCRLPVADLRSTSRRSDLVRARSLAMYLIRSLTGASLQETGKMFGNRDHTTVLHAVRKVDSLRSSDPDIRRALTELVNTLSPGDDE